MFNLNNNFKQTDIFSAKSLCLPRTCSIVLIEVKFLSTWHKFQRYEAVWRSTCFCRKFCYSENNCGAVACFLGVFYVLEGFHYQFWENLQEKNADWGWLKSFHYQFWENLVEKNADWAGREGWTWNYQWSIPFRQCKLLRNIIKHACRKIVVSKRTDTNSILMTLPWEKSAFLREDVNKMW